MREGREGDRREGGDGGRRVKEGGEGGREGREGGWGGREGRRGGEGGRGGMTVIHIIMAPQYLHNDHVTY